MPKRKKKTKSVKRTTRGGVTQSVKIVIGSTAPKRKARSYLKPSNTQGHNLMTPQLISTRQEPFDLALLGNLQQRMNKIDNLNKGIYDRDFAEEAQRQLRQEVVEEKQSEEAVSQMVAEDMSKQKTSPVAETKPKRGRPSTRPILPVGLPYPQGPELPTSAGISTLDPAYGLPVAESRAVGGKLQTRAVVADTNLTPQKSIMELFTQRSQSQPATLRTKSPESLGITSTPSLERFGFTPSGDSSTSSKPSTQLKIDEKPKKTPPKKKKVPDAR